MADQIVDDVGPPSEDEEVVLPERFGGALPRDPADDFVVGSIVRIRMENFMSTSLLEFRPGPRLNFVIGPNGSGKSTILSAIALALNFPLAVVDRGKSATGFIKRDSNERWAAVEVELKNIVGEENVIIRRVIELIQPLKEKGPDNKSTFTINGELATGKAVSDLVLSLYIQVDNLTVFMPQERVAELANMSPEALLRATEKAAGGDALHDLHTKLISLKREEVAATKTVGTAQKDLDTREGEMAALQRDMDRFLERRAIEKTLAVLHLHLPWARYRAAKALFDELKVTKLNLKRELDQAKLGDVPYTEMVELLEARVKALEQTRKTHGEKHNKLQTDHAKSAAALGKHEEATDNEKNVMANIRQEEEQRVKSIAEAEAKVTRLAAKLDAEPPVPFDRTELNRLNAERVNVRNEIQHVSNQGEELKRSIAESEAQRNAALAAIQRAESVAVQREMALAQQGGGVVMQAVHWIRQNQHLLKGRVHEPIQLSVSCRNLAYARQLDACLPVATLRTILCEHEDDYRLLSSELVSKKGWRVNLASLTEHHDLANFHPPFSPDELHALGFECYALDQADAPPAVLGFLCQGSNLHRIPITQNPNAVIDHARLERAESGVRRYMTHDSRVTIGFSNYGAREAFTTTSTLQPSRNFDLKVDHALIQRRRQELAVIEEAIAPLIAQTPELARRDQNLRQAHDNVMSRIEAEREAADRVTKALRTIAGVKTQHNAAILKLQTFRKRATGAQQRAKCKAKLQSLANKHFDLVCAHKDLLVRLGESLAAGTAHAFQLAQATTDLKVLEDVLAERSESHADKEEAFNTARREHAKARQAAMDIRASALARQAEVTPDILAVFEAELPEVRALPLDQIEQRTELAEASLAAAPSVSATVEASLKKLQGRIAALKDSLAGQTAMLDKHRRRLRRLQDKYDPAIKQLVGSISTNFSKCFAEMKLLGEVQVDRNEEDYAQWGIKIMVSFREGDDMQRLTTKHQSGGERALSTVVYFMSLMRQAKTPFTVVDEINQGMDQNNERAMHDHLVRVTCDQDAGQTFLVTPKLLTGLRYSEHMRVLCIGNGPWLPEEFDMDALLRRHKKRRIG